MSVASHRNFFTLRRGIPSSCPVSMNVDSFSCIVRFATSAAARSAMGFVWSQKGIDAAMLSGAHVRTGGSGGGGGGGPRESKHRPDPLFLSPLPYTSQSQLPLQSLAVQGLYAHTVVPGAVPYPSRLMQAAGVSVSTMSLVLASWVQRWSAVPAVQGARLMSIPCGPVPDAARHFPLHKWAASAC
jgi:hypothetical protein